MGQRLLGLRQADVVDLSWVFAQAYGAHANVGIRSQSLEPHYGGGPHPGVAAEKKLEQLLGVRPGNKRWSRICRILAAIDQAAQCYLEAAYDPFPESFDGYTRRDAGILFSITVGENHRHTAVAREPHNPYFDPIEGALVRYTPTLRTRAIRQLAEEQRTRDTYVAHTSAIAAGAEPCEVIRLVHEAAEAAEKDWTWVAESPLHRAQEVDARVLELVERAIKAACAPAAKGAGEAREAARAVLSQAKREANELHDAAADAYVRARDILSPKRRAPRVAAPALRWDDAAAWADAAE